MHPSAWRGRSVLLTGDTGFKGGWLSLWLHELGAEVHGYATDPPTTPSLFEVGQIRSTLASHTHADLADLAQLQSVVQSRQPQVIFHMAAQSLVRVSYSDPLGTLATNIMGTAHVLEAARAVESVRAIVVITTDKVYGDSSSAVPHHEEDALGGHDPYSASKAAAEIVASSYRASFFSGASGHAARIATARAGNVIGGGDWAADRLIPDCLRAFTGGQPVRLRYPEAVRPWQHVLEPLAGYLLLAECLLKPQADSFEMAWNFGPSAKDNASVGQVAEAVARLWNEGAHVMHEASESNPHENPVLSLDSTRARSKIGWLPRWSLQEALERTVDWHRAWQRGANMQEFSREQIAHYQSALPL
jgi:CDP-glucose 4,6-dehydratase